MANVIGPDVSFYQDDPQTPQGIDFRKMAASAAFAIIRAGQNLWVDPDFKMNWREAKLANLPRGSYWFYDSRADPKRQAELWVQQFGGDFGELPLFADIEEAYNGPFAGWRNWVTFLDRLKALVGTKEIAIYTAFYYWRDNAPAAGTPNLEYFHQYPLWIANYGVTQPLIPRPWTSNEWLFWQYTEAGDGKLFGVESNGIDLNYFHGDLAAFKARFHIPDTLPPPPNPDGDPGTPTGKFYKVTATSLNVREGPGLSYNAIGLLSQNEVVEEIGANADRTWLRVRRSDNSLKGWCFAAYLQPQNTTPPPPFPDPGDPGTPTGKMYKVTATALQVREGPGLNYKSIGLLSQNEVVEEIGANADRSWLRIRRTNNSLRGWSFAAYLQSVDTPPPDGSTRNWYRVNLASLPIRETPNIGAKKLGILAKDDSIAALDDTSNPDWIQVIRLDGLTGWCQETFLEFRGTSRPASYRQMLFNGVSYLRKDLTDPRKLIVHVLSIDTQTAGLQFLVTPPNFDNGVLCTKTTSRFLSQFGMHIAINGDGFSYFVPTPPPSVTCTDGDPVKVNGYAVSQKNVYSPRKTADPIIYFNQRNMVTIDEPKGQVINAISGDRLIVSKGKVVKNLPASTPEPRTALGLNRGNRWLQLMVIDGRQDGISEGVTLAELADQMISIGVFTGVNMDGGSSSTMVIKGSNGAPLVVNSPVEENIPGKESKVANHLGIFLQQP